MKKNYFTLTLSLSALSLSTVALADRNTGSEIKLRAEAEAVRADARLKDAQTALIYEQVRLQALLRIATQDEVSLFHQKMLFAKSLLIESRKLQGEVADRKMRFQVLEQGLSRLQDGLMIGAASTQTLFHELAIRPSDPAAYRSARNRLIGEVQGVNFRCFSRPCVEPAESFPGGTVIGLVEYLSSHRYDLAPIEQGGVEALEAIGVYSDHMIEGLDGKRTENVTSTHSRIDALVVQVRELSEFKKGGQPIPDPK